jgi:hypothetical protein
VGHERIAHEGRQRHDPPARDGLRFDEFQPAVDPRECVAHCERASLEIDIGPAQAEDLTLPEPDTEGDQVERLEPIAGDRGDERSDLLDRERRDPPPWDARRPGKTGDVAGDEIGPLGVAKRPTQDAPQVPTVRGDRPDAAFALRNA